MPDGDPSPRSTHEVAASLSKTLDDLRSNHPKNLLFTNEFREVPPHFVSVFRLHPESRLDEAALAGVRPTPEYIAEHGQDRAALDNLFDKAAPPGFSRTHAVYAYPEYGGVNSGANASSGNVVLEMKVDPTKVFVTDQDVYTEARLSLERYGSTEERERDYWQNAITLEAYLNLPEAKRQEMFTLPEVVIPNGVEPQNVRVVGIK